jgi:flagellar hook-length control protein FliK
LQQPQQLEVVPGQDLDEELVPTANEDGSPPKAKATKSVRLETGNRVPERPENQTPIVSVQSRVDSNSTPDSHHENPQKQDPEVEVFHNAIHHALANSTAPAGEEVKPVQLTVQPTIEPAVIHRTLTSPPDYASGAAPTEILTEPQKASVISQIVEKAQLLVRDNNAEIVVALKPDSLGRITLRASMVDNQVVTTIIAESHAVKSVLQADLPALHAVLQEAGVDTRHVIVTRETDMNFSGAPSNNSFGFHHPQHSNHQQGTPSHPRGHEEFPWITMDSPNPDVATVPVPLDTRYSARSIHYIA